MEQECARCNPPRSGWRVVQPPEAPPDSSPSTCPGGNHCADLDCFHGAWAPAVCPVMPAAFTSTTPSRLIREERSVAALFSSLVCSIPLYERTLHPNGHGAVSRVGLRCVSAVDTYTHFCCLRFRNETAGA